MSDKQVSKFEYGSRFLYAEDLIRDGAYNDIDVEIAEYHEPNTIRTEAGKMIDRPAVGFAGKSKMLVLCRTNAAIIGVVLRQRDPRQWIGGKIRLGPRVVDAFGTEVAAVRVIPPAGTVLRRGLLTRLGRRIASE
jgi:hypothetical protein